MNRRSEGEEGLRKRKRGKRGVKKKNKKKEWLKRRKKRRVGKEKEEGADAFLWFKDFGKHFVLRKKR